MFADEVDVVLMILVVILVSLLQALTVYNELKLEWLDNSEHSFSIHV